MQIKKLTENDASNFQKIRLQALQNNPEAFGSTYEEEKENSVDNFRERLNQNPNNFVLAVFDDQEVIQGMLGVVKQLKNKTKHQADIWGTYISPSFRGKGAAKSMIAKSIEAIKEMNDVEKVRIAVVTTNTPAKKLYESFGFKGYGTEAKAFKHENEYFDIEHMALFL